MIRIDGGSDEMFELCIETWTYSVKVLTDQGEVTCVFLGHREPNDALVGLPTLLPEEAAPREGVLERDGKVLAQAHTVLLA